MAEKKSVRCIIIAGSPVCDYEFIKSYIKDDDFIICADKGCECAEKLNIIPDLIVGDFDSFSGVLPDTQIIKLNTHKDDTDTEHCAKEAVLRGFKNVVILNATGARQDHTFANFCVLKYLNDNNVDCKIVDRYETIIVKSTGVYRFKGLNDVTFSVFPFGCSESKVSYIGECEYSGENITLNSSSAKGISNIFRSDNVTIEVLSGNILLFIEKTI